MTTDVYVLIFYPRGAGVGEIEAVFASRDAAERAITTQFTDEERAEVQATFPDAVWDVERHYFYPDPPD